MQLQVGGEEAGRQEVTDVRKEGKGGEQCSQHMC